MLHNIYSFIESEMEGILLQRLTVTSGSKGKAHLDSMLPYWIGLIGETRERRNLMLGEHFPVSYPQRNIAGVAKEISNLTE